jgi:hypothetical protein
MDKIVLVDVTLSGCQRHVLASDVKNGLLPCGLSSYGDRTHDGFFFAFSLFDFLTVVCYPYLFACFLVSSVEEAARLYEQSPEVGDEIWQGHLGLQGIGQGLAQIQGQDDLDREQLSALAQIGSRIFEHVGQDARAPLFR